jgi:hypothetical protein
MLRVIMTRSVPEADDSGVQLGKGQQEVDEG